jgi:hypothetical protein
MSASNFYKKNASFYYVFEGRNEWEFESFLEELGSELEKIDFEYWNNPKLWEWINKDALKVAVKEIYFKHRKSGITWGILRIYVILRYGYYGGMNLDWDWEFEFADGSCYAGNDFSSSEIEDYGNYLKNDIPYWWSDNKPPREYYLGKYLIKNCSKLYDKVMDVLDKETKKLEKVFEKLTEVYDLVTVFSNGEAVYRKVKKNE